MRQLLVFKKMNAVLFGALLCATPLAFGAETSSGYTFVSVLMLAMLAAAVAVLAWLMRRGAAGGAGAASSMRVLAAQALGPRERLVVVSVGGRFFLLGHTANQVNMLTELAPEDVPQPSHRLPENLFADLLKKLKR